MILKGKGKTKKSPRSLPVTEDEVWKKRSVAAELTASTGTSN
jgi:hypothetical protein